MVAMLAFARMLLLDLSAPLEAVMASFFHVNILRASEFERAEACVAAILLLFWHENLTSVECWT